MAKRPFLSFRIEHKNKKKGIRHVLLNLDKVDSHQVSAGIHKNEGTKLENRKKGKKINIATVAYLMEQHRTWKLEQTEKFIGANGEQIIVEAGSVMTQPARYFIHLDKVPQVWIGVVDFIKNSAKNVLNFKAVKDTRAMFDSIGQFVSQQQQNVIINKIGLAPNSELTQKLKGFNLPLVNTGKLIDSIKYKVTTNKNRANLKSTCSDIFNLDSIIDRINKT